MIVLDTHIWIWWVNDDPLLKQRTRDLILESLVDRIGVSVISCWELGMLVARGRVQLGIDVNTWIGDSLCLPEMELLDLTPPIAVASSNLPGEFHGDPADRILVATARSHDCPLLTVDHRILTYPHVKMLT